ncbi:MAG: ammonium transporter [Alistipes onderdonkii]
MKKRWIVFFAVLLAISVLGLFRPVPKLEFWGLENHVDKADVAWMITATIFVLMMTPGLSFFYGGMVRAKNVISTILQSFIAMGIISVLWVTVSSACRSATTSDIRRQSGPFFMFEGVDGMTTGCFLRRFHSLFACSDEIRHHHPRSSRVLAERVRFSAYMVSWCFSVCSSLPAGPLDMAPGRIPPPAGVLDFAGRIVVHASSGVAALAGPFSRQTEKSRRPPAANVPFVLLGAAILWLGWFGFNAGSSFAADSVAVKAFLNTNTASATAMIVVVSI